jgi:hypothetical protein
MVSKEASAMAVTDSRKKKIRWFVSTINYVHKDEKIPRELW